MARAVKPGGTIVVSDEIPNLTDRMLVPQDRPARGSTAGSSRKMTEEPRRRLHRHGRAAPDLDIAAIGRRVLDDCRYELIWMGVGYVMVGTASRS